MRSTPGKDMPLTSFADAFASHRVIAAADKSAAEGTAGEALRRSPLSRRPATSGTDGACDRYRDRRTPRRHRVRHGRTLLLLARRRLGDSLPESLDRQSRQPDRCRQRKPPACEGARRRAAAKLLGATWHPPICDDLEIFYDDRTLAPAERGRPRGRSRRWC